MFAFFTFKYLAVVRDGVTSFKTIDTDHAAALPLIILFGLDFGLLNYTQDVLCLGLNRPF